MVKEINFGFAIVIGSCLESVKKRIIIIIEELVKRDSKLREGCYQVVVLHSVARLATED